jgi:glycosyltransferase involved in cell wall biosynthesis
LRAELSLPQSATIILFVGSVKERKGVHDLVNAFVQASRMHADLHLLIVGPKNVAENPSIDESYVKQLEHVLKQNSLLQHVTFTGLIQDKCLLSKYYRASDVFVFLSQNEGLPNVVLEAMASSLPVVVSQIPVLAGVIKQFENGLIVRSCDPSEIASSISLILNDASFRQQLRINALNTIGCNHTYQKWQDSLVHFYSIMLGKGAMN